MPWYAYVLIGGAILNAAGNIYLIGRPRKPITHGEAIVATVFAVLYTWAIVSLAT